MAEHQWYFLKTGMIDDETIGPLAEKDFLQMIRDGHIKPTTQIMSPSRTGGGWWKVNQIGSYMSVWEQGHIKRVELKRTQAEERARLKAEATKVKAQAKAEAAEAKARARAEAADAKAKQQALAEQQAEQQRRFEPEQRQLAQPQTPAEAQLPPPPGMYGCPTCGQPLTAKTKRQRASGPSSCLLELIGLLIIVFTFFTIVGPIIGFLFIILGHYAAYKKVNIYVCRSCKSRFPGA